MPPEHPSGEFWAQQKAALWKAVEKTPTNPEKKCSRNPLCSKKYALDKGTQKSALKKVALESH